MSGLRWFLSVAAMVGISVFCRGGPAVPSVIATGEIGVGLTSAAGAQPGDGFARRLQVLGDVNGDNRVDLAFLANVESEESAENVSYIFFGRDTLPERIELANWPAWGIRINGSSGAYFSCPDARLGDLDGDGFADMVFRPSIPGLSSARALVLFGSANLPQEISLSELAPLRSCEIHADATVTHERIASFTAGDLDGDGFTDLVLGSSNSSPPEGLAGTGVVHVVFGSGSWPARLELTALGDELRGCRITDSYSNPSDMPALRLGARVKASHDFDADGRDDLVVAEPRWDRGAVEHEFGGIITVLFGRAEWPAAVDLDLDRGENTCRLYATTKWQWLGQSALETTPDVTGDGRPDLLVGASGFGAGCYLVGGNDLVRGMFPIDERSRTFFSGAESFSAAGIGDWDGDGINDVLLGALGADTTPLGVTLGGMAHLIRGRTDFPDFFSVDGPEPWLSRIAGSYPYGAFGAMVGGADITGDGVPELVFSAPGPMVGEEREQATGRLYLVAGGTDLLGALTGERFVPKASTLGGDGRLYVLGRGFDEETRLYVGEIEVEILSRPHSRTVIGRIPPADEPVALPVRLERAGENFSFEDRLSYYDRLFPHEVDMLDLGAQGCVIEEPRYESWPYRLETGSKEIEGGEDFTGDGLGDVVFTYSSGWVTAPDMPRNGPPEVYLLRGNRELPQSISLAEDFSEWIITFESDGTGDDRFGYSAHLVGDMNGDNRSELVITARNSGLTYVVFGRDLPPGRYSVYDLVEEEGGVVIEGCPIAPETETTGWLKNTFYTVKAGDLNGDGFMDFGLVCELAEDPDSYVTSSLAFLFGGEDLHGAVDYASLPKVYGLRRTSTARLMHVKGLGDVDDDGYEDLSFSAVGYRDHETGGDPGIVLYVVLFGREEFSRETHIEEELTEGGACEVLRASGGGYLRRIGDQNGDGKADIGVLYAPFGAQGPVVDRGRLYIIYGRLRDDLRGERSVGNPRDFDVTFTSSSPYNGFLHELDGGRDINGDGQADILICDQHKDYAPPPSRGIVIFGGSLEEKAGPIEEVEERFDLVNYHSLPRMTDSNDFPVRLDFAGDVNGDGYEDLVAYDRARVYVYFNPLGVVETEFPFTRGDANQDGSIDIADAVAILGYLFSGSQALPCDDAADANDDETLNIADPVQLLSRLFAQAPPLPPPNDCGFDAEGDGLSCRDSICR